MTQNNTPNEPVVATGETQNSITKTGKVMTASTNCNINNERGQKLKDILEGIGERSRREWKEISTSYRDAGGEYEDFKNHYVQKNIKNLEQTAEDYWKKEFPNSGLATLQHCQGDKGSKSDESTIAEVIEALKTANDVLQKIGPEVNQEEIKEICQAFQQCGGSFEEYRKWTVRILSSQWSKVAYSHWREATGDYDMSTLESYAERYQWKTKK